MIKKKQGIMLQLYVLSTAKVPSSAVNSGFMVCFFSSLWKLCRTKVWPSSERLEGQTVSNSAGRQQNELEGISESSRNIDTSRGLTVCWHPLCMPYLFIFWGLGGGGGTYSTLHWAKGKKTPHSFDSFLNLSRGWNWSYVLFVYSWNINKNS